jgi:hypothetical protein
LTLQHKNNHVTDLSEIKFAVSFTSTPADLLADHSKPPGGYDDSGSTPQVIRDDIYAATVRYGSKMRMQETALNSAKQRLESHRQKLEPESINYGIYSVPRVNHNPRSRSPSVSSDTQGKLILFQWLFILTLIYCIP